jgi:polar amino acid transport system substrate-binding protein
MAASMTGEGTDYADLTVIKSMNLTAEEYAIGFRLNSTAVAQFNKVTDELIKDGTLPKIAEKYELAERLIKK